MKAVMRCSQAIKSILKVLCDLGPELMFVQLTDCLFLSAASPNRLIVAEAKLSRSAFQKYIPNKDKPVFSVDSKLLSRILSRANLHPIEFNVKGQKMIATILQPYLRQFSCATKRQDKPVFSLRERRYPVIRAISSKHFYEIVADASTVGDELGIEVSGKYLVFKASGDSSDFTCRMLLDKNIGYGREATVMMSTLRALAPVARNCDFIDIGVDCNRPLTLEFRSKKQPASFRCIISTRRHKSLHS